MSSNCEISAFLSVSHRISPFVLLLWAQDTTFTVVAIEGCVTLAICSPSHCIELINFSCSFSPMCLVVGNMDMTLKLVHLL